MKYVSARCPGDVELICNNLTFVNSTESSSDLVEGAYGNTNSRLIYGVFSTPSNAISGSAICAFSLQVRMNSKSKRQKAKANPIRPRHRLLLLRLERNKWRHRGWFSCARCHRSAWVGRKSIFSLISNPFFIMESFPSTSFLVDGRQPNWKRKQFCVPRCCSSVRLAGRSSQRIMDQKPVKRKFCLSILLVANTFFLFSPLFPCFRP